MRPRRAAHGGARPLNCGVRRLLVDAAFYLFFYGITVVLPLAFLVWPLLLRKRAWLVGYALGVGGGLCVLQLYRDVIASRPDYVDGGPFGGIGDAVQSLW